MSVLYPALTSSLENYPALLEMFRMMIVVVMFDRLPSNINRVAILKAIDRF